jgi:hypothetical protein
VDRRRWLIGTRRLWIVALVILVVAIAVFVVLLAVALKAGGF